MQTCCGQELFEFMQMPRWWLVVGPLLPLLSVAVAYNVLHELSGRKGILTVAILPSSGGVANLACAGGASLALNSNATPLLTHAAAFARCACVLRYTVHDTARCPTAASSASNKPTLQ